MANTASAIKRVRQEAKRRVRNRMVKSRMRTFVKQANEAIEKGDRGARRCGGPERHQRDRRAASKGVIHSNNASRSKSRLMLRLNGLAE